PFEAAAVARKSAPVRGSWAMMPLCGPSLAKKAAAATRCTKAAAKKAGRLVSGAAVPELVVADQEQSGRSPDLRLDSPCPTAAGVRLIQIKSTQAGLQDNMGARNQGVP